MFPLHFPYRASPCAIRFQLSSTARDTPIISWCVVGSLYHDCDVDKKVCNAIEVTPTSLLFTYGVFSPEINFKTRVFEQLSNKVCLSYNVCEFGPFSLCNCFDFILCLRTNYADNFIYLFLLFSCYR